MEEMDGENSLPVYLQGVAARRTLSGEQTETFFPGALQMMLPCGGRERG